MASSGGGSGTREIISVGVGEAGTRVSTEIWKQYCREHGIAADGSRTFSERECEEHTGWFFRESEDTRLTPMNLFVDTDPDGIDGILSGEMRSLFDPKHILVGTEDAASNYARGYYTVGREMMMDIGESIRRLVERCSHLFGLMVTHSTAGGTGSGLTPLISNYFATNYRRKARLGFVVYPRRSHRELSTTAHLNTLLCSHQLLNNQHASVVFDNQAVYNLVHRDSDDNDIDSISSMNDLISDCICSMTSDVRFPSAHSTHILFSTAQLINFPKLAFLIPSISNTMTMTTVSPISKDDKNHSVMESMMRHCFNHQSFLIDFPFWDDIQDQYESLAFNFIVSNDKDLSSVNKSLLSAMMSLKKSKKINFLEWCPTGLRNSTTMIPNNSEDKLVSIGVNTAMGRFMRRRVLDPFRTLYRRKSFVHWYIGEGMEEREMKNAEEDIAAMVQDYGDLLGLDDGDDEDEES